MKTRERYIFSSSAIILTIVFTVLTRAPVLSPDSQGHLRMAANMAEKGCMSYNGECTPTTTDQGPI